MFYNFIMTIEAALLCIKLSLILATGECPPMPPPVEQMPIFASWYDPALGGTNCNGDCSNISQGKFTPEMYGVVAACPVEWLGQWLDVPGIGKRRCMDTGSRIHPMYREVYTAVGFVWGWFVVIDFMESAPPAWRYEVFSDWRLQ